MRGVRFAALKAPGPSGMRAEHLSELLGIPRKRVANKLLGSLSKLARVIKQGLLCEDARWITRSRTIFIGEKHSDEPRPHQGRRGVAVN